MSLPSWLWWVVPAAVPIALAAVWLLRRLTLPVEERSFWTLRRPLARLVERRLGGYRQQVNPIDIRLPERLDAERRVAVIGAGLAGIAAASTLAERGYRVTLIDANAYLGGKIGAWESRDGDAVLSVDHGFHAFFRHYYNLNDYLTRLGVLSQFAAIDDYVILERSQQRLAFAQIEPTPLLNLLALERAGLYRMSEIARTRAIDKMDAFLTYDQERTFADLDQVSYRDFANDAELPAGLRKVFTTFSRAFFAEDDRLSMAQLIKSFHFYYLSHDHGLLYDYPVQDYQTALLTPIEADLRRLRVTIQLAEPVRRIDYDGKHYCLAGDSYDDLVIATPAVVAAKLLAASPSLAAHVPELAHKLNALPRSQRYAVLRLWLDTPLSADVPVFVSTERERVLDAVALYHRITPSARDFAAQHGGCVLELHSYAVPDEVDDGELSRLLIEELHHHFAELRGANVLHQVLQIRDDFTAFHCGTASNRPTSRTQLASLTLAGDWVTLPIPAMLMEAAFSSGLYAANALLERDGLRAVPIYSVPLRGILAPLEDFKRRRRPARPESAGQPQPCREAAE